MSYSFGIYFKSINSLKQAIIFMQQFNKILLENAEERIELSKYYMPSSKNGLTKEYEEADNKWLYEVMTPMFIYWDKYKLLGVFGDRMTKANQDMGFSHIDFQNSCDVDYDFSYWGTIPIFKKIIKQYKNATTYDLYSEYKSTKTLEELYEDLDYYTKSMVYHKIFEILDLENYLCGKEGNYQRFHLSSINCIEDYYKCQIALMKVKKNLHFE